ncbi:MULTISPECIES: helix-turn-helix domain-containing protein [unclassified Streptomyces]|uniref:helix-turn-helix domain-containing protein n=1 Tax=unclassified Streptomyces TaxID=2593676 RepID=UPI0004BD0371|nr:MULTISPECIES: transposase family protein [unclassified Streptomyces]
MVGNASRAAIISDRRITGLSADVIAELVAELGPLWHERHQARLVSRPRKRVVGAGAKHRLVFVDRLLATLVHLRHATTHGVLACWFGVDRSTITRAIGEVRPLLAERGCTVSPDVRLRTLAEVVDHLGSSGTTGIIDGTEIRVRRPAAGRKDQRQRKAHSSRRIRVEHGIAHLKNWRALARHLGRREHISDTVQAVASLLSHQQIADLHPTPQT